jgi:hypothetical protein
MPFGCRAAYNAASEDGESGSRTARAARATYNKAFNDAWKIRQDARAAARATYFGERQDEAAQIAYAAAKIKANTTWERQESRPDRLDAAKATVESTWKAAKDKADADWKAAMTKRRWEPAECRRHRPLGRDPRLCCHVLLGPRGLDRPRRRRRRRHRDLVRPPLLDRGHRHRADFCRVTGEPVPAIPVRRSR